MQFGVMGVTYPMNFLLGHRGPNRRIHATAANLTVACPPAARFVHPNDRDFQWSKLSAPAANVVDQRP
jgi:hypothetical protein